MNHESKSISNLSPEEKRKLLEEKLRKLADASESSIQNKKNVEDMFTEREMDLQLFPDPDAEPGLSPVVDKDRCNTIIESFGVYLPPKSVSTKEVLKGCKKKVLLPLERLTGIKSRRMAGETEFSIDLAKKAIEECLAYSKYKPENVDMLICCNISRYDAPLRVSFEPNTSAKLKKHFGFHNALIFDLTNACTGMWTGVSIVDTFLNLGMIQCGMVVSGEYITHLIQTAQKEIKGVTDKRVACLTLGDAGAALILERAPDNNIGFHEIDLYTVGRYSQYCTAMVTDQEHGGAIMLTDTFKLTAVNLQHAIMHADYTRKRIGWSPDTFQHLIMHQVSKMSLDGAIRKINKLYQRNICNQDNVINNLIERGNTATTTHMVALKDCIEQNRVKSGDNVFFSIYGSGLTIGSAYYTLDDLPDRMQRQEVSKQKPRELNPLPSPRFRVESIGTIPTITEAKDVNGDSLELSKMAAEECLKNSSYDRSDIDLLIYTGVYRKDFLCEPAIATLLAGQLSINADINSLDQKRTFAFDIFNGGVGFLNACYVAIQMIRAKKLKNAMIITSEIENNADAFPEKQLGLQETASALILEQTSEDNGKSGFGHFIFDYFTDYLGAFTSHLTWIDGKAYLNFNKDPNIYDYYCKCIPGTVHKLLSRQGLDISQIKIIFPPQISSSFILKLSDQMNVSKDKFVDIAREGRDLFTSSMPYTFQYAREYHLVDEGDVGLIINTGSGIQVGCAVYYF
ncbi:MAG: 3-oxoacyl-ACP synthase [Candidatus Aminicenantes bacterium]|nr:3-oxoacyl-ACP synthase [Candidatus Aminicenantes bacterium]NIQ68366.1 3-oxoacyl-ACP synthase [Candidatus Aminicenantes bacterium]NIT24409.1 3-oxoacyl-ACP synthase [Candidatus Aminicenantes bacterium]